MAVRLIHKRPFLTVITPNLSVDWKKIGKSFGLFFGLVALATVVDYLLNPSTYQFRLNPERFLIFAPVALVLIPIQTTAEELLFRGYLLQSMALLTRNRVALVLISGLLFMVPHLANPEMTAGFWSMAFYYFLVGGILTIITLRSNSLEMAMGIHAAINLFAALIVNYANSALETESIFYCTEIEPIFTVVSFAVIALVFYMVMFRAKDNTEEAASELGFAGLLWRISLHGFSLTPASRRYCGSCSLFIPTSLGDLIGRQALSFRQIAPLRFVPLRIAL